MTLRACGKLRCCFILIVAAVVKPALGETLEDYSGERYRLQTILVAENEFTIGRLVALGKTFVKRTRRQAFARLRIVTQREDARMGGLASTHGGYGAVVYLAQSAIAATSHWRYAEVVMIQGDAVLRARFNSRHRRTVVLQGRNPLEHVFDGTQIRLEWLAHWAVGDNLVPLDQGFLHNVSVYAISASPINERLAERVFVALKVRIPHLLFEVEFAPSTWFPFSEHFPMLFPFGPAVLVRDEKDYLKVPRVSCRQNIPIGVICSDSSKKER